MKPFDMKCRSILLLLIQTRLYFDRLSNVCWCLQNSFPEHGCFFFCSFSETSLAAMVTGLGVRTETAMTATVCITRPSCQRPGASMSPCSHGPPQRWPKGLMGSDPQRPMGPSRYVLVVCFVTALWCLLLGAYQWELRLFLHSCLQLFNHLPNLFELRPPQNPHTHPKKKEKEKPTSTITLLMLQELHLFSCSARPNLSVNGIVHASSSRQTA